jgi:hypothetical protein
VQEILQLFGEFKALLCLTQHLLLHNLQGTCQIHDFNGNFVAQLCMHFGVKGSTTPDIVGIDWYNGLEGHIDPGAPTLALAFLNGKLQVILLNKTESQMGTPVYKLYTKNLVMTSR